MAVKRRMEVEVQRRRAAGGMKGTDFRLRQLLAGRDGDQVGLRRAQSDNGRLQVAGLEVFHLDTDPETSTSVSRFRASHVHGEYPRIALG
jgi:hypothetical protein